MSIQTHLDGVLRSIQTHPSSPEAAEISRLTLRIRALYQEMNARATEGDLQSHPFEGPVPQESES